MQKISVSQNNIFNQFLEYNKEIERAKSAAQKNMADSVELRSKQDDETNNKYIYSSLMTVGVLSLLFARGLHGSSIKKLQNKLSYFESDSATTTLYYLRLGASKLLKGLQATSNITTIKDVLFDKLCKRNKYTAQYANNARELEKKLINNTISKKYDKVGNYIDDIISLVQSYHLNNIQNLDGKQMISIKGEQKSLETWSNELYNETLILRNNFSNNFGLGARKVRSNRRDKKLIGIRQEINRRLLEEKGWKKIELYKTYITEEVSKNSQFELQEQIVSARKSVTNNIECICDYIGERLSDIRYSRKVKDRRTDKIIKEAEQLLKQYRTCSGENETAERKYIANSILGKLNFAKGKIQASSLYTDLEKKELHKIIEDTKKEIITAEQSKGALENVMTMLSGLNKAKAKEGMQVITDSEFQQCKTIANKISKSIQEASDKEAGEYFLKQAEMEIGSAATDIFSILLPVGVGTYAIAKCDNKEERISAALKTCIPLIGTFGTFIYGTTKMLSGAKNLIFSVFSGFTLNKFGTYIDSLYKDYTKSGSVVEVAKGEYKNVWSDLSSGITDKKSD